MHFRRFEKLSTKIAWSGNRRLTFYCDTNSSTTWTVFWRTIPTYFMPHHFWPRKRQPSVWGLLNCDCQRFWWLKHWQRPTDVNKIDYVEMKTAHLSFIQVFLDCNPVKRSGQVTKKPLSIRFCINRNRPCDMVTLDIKRIGMDGIFSRL